MFRLALKPNPICETAQVYVHRLLFLYRYHVLVLHLIMALLLCMTGLAFVFDWPCVCVWHLENFSFAFVADEINMPIPATATPEQLFTYMLAHAASFRMDVLEHHEERTTSTLPGCGSQVIGSDRIKTSLLVVGSVPHVVFMYSNVRLLLSVPELHLAKHVAQLVTFCYFCYFCYG